MAEKQKSNNKSNNKMAPSIIGKDTIITGQIESSGDIQIDGKLHGNIISHAITIGATAQVEGELLAESVTVYGHVTGTIRALQVFLCTDCVVSGDIYHLSLAIESGAKFDGRSLHDKDPLNKSNAETKPSTEEQWQI